MMNHPKRPTSARDVDRPLSDYLEHLGGFVRELRERFTLGEYARLGPVDLGEWAPLRDPELVVRIMLADWDHFDDLSPEQRNDFLVAVRRLSVLLDLRTLEQR